MSKDCPEKAPGVISAMRSAARRRMQLLLALAVLALGISGALVLKYTRRAPERSGDKPVPPLVKIERVRQGDIRVVVRGYGTVRAQAEAEVVPQVSGKVVAINPDFRDGGFVRAGAVLIEIDPRDYELAVQRAEAEVAKAQVDLDLEKAEAEVARQEWEQLNPGMEPPSELIVREPQIRQARTTLEAAKAQLATAELSLERTKVSLPFDGRVVNETVDLGQYVTAGRAVGTVYGIEAVEIEVPLEDRELAWFDIPSNPVSINGSVSSKVPAEVEVRSEFAGGEHTWAGRLVRTTGEIDRTSRLVSVVVEVCEPFRGADGRPPLVPGMFVEVIIKGRTLSNAIPVRRYAIHNGSEVWAVRGGRLNIRGVEIAREDEDYAYVVSGLEDGTDVIVSSLDAVTDGMEVRYEGFETDANSVKEAD